MSAELDANLATMIDRDVRVYAHSTSAPWPFVRGVFECRLVDIMPDAVWVADPTNANRRMLMMRSALLAVELR